MVLSGSDIGHTIVQIARSHTAGAPGATGAPVGCVEPSEGAEPTPDQARAGAFEADGDRWASRACCASLANAVGLAMASSDRLLRSSVTPAFFSPLMSVPYVSPCSRAAALMRTTHSRRKSRFLRRRPTKAYLSAVSTDSFAARYSLLLLA